ncbi:MAG: TlpA disulfide reductase family protein [Marinifilaceae bacterium]
MISCSSNESVELRIMLNIPNVDKLILTTPADFMEVKLDEFGLGSASIKIEKGCFASVFCAGKGFDIFLTPNKDIDLKISQDNSLINYEIKCDDGGINDYLLQDIKRKRTLPYISFKLDEAKYIDKINTLLKKELKVADNLLFSEKFKTINAERIKYDVLYSLSVYPQYHSYETDNIDYLPSQFFIDFVNVYFNEQYDLFGYSAYISYMDNISVCNANRYLKDWDSRDFTVNVMDFIQKKIKHQKLKEILITKRLNHYLTGTGLDKSDAFLSVFNKNVKSKYYIDEINSIVTRLKALEKGKKSYSFIFKDKNSKSVSLDSLKGKYKYICVWSSWCIPCRKDLIDFNLLRKKYKEKNIEFVSVSIDQNRKEWKIRLKEDNLEGMQLNYFGDNKFLEAYMIYSIPRFILLDKNGLIINSRELSASDDKIEDLLNAISKKKSSL